MEESEEQKHAVEAAEEQKLAVEGSEEQKHAEEPSQLLSQPSHRNLQYLYTFNV